MPDKAGAHSNPLPAQCGPAGPNAAWAKSNAESNVASAVPAATDTVLPNGPTDVVAIVSLAVIVGLALKRFQSQKMLAIDWRPGCLTEWVTPGAG